MSQDTQPNYSLLVILLRLIVSAKVALLSGFSCLVTASRLLVWRVPRANSLLSRKLSSYRNNVTYVICNCVSVDAGYKHSVGTVCVVPITDMSL